MSFLENTFVRTIELTENLSLKIHQLEVGDVGCCVWDAALVLIKYLETKEFWKEDGTHIFEGADIIELGSGTGAVGIAAAALGANVKLTDLKKFLPLLNLNIKANCSMVKGKLNAETLEWGQTELETKPLFILVADCLYYEQSVLPLIKTLSDMCDYKTVVIFSYEDRSEQGKEEIQNEFFEELKKIFHVEYVPLKDLHEEFRSPDIHVLKFRKKTCK